MERPVGDELIGSSGGTRLTFFLLWISHLATDLRGLRVKVFTNLPKQGQRWELSMEITMYDRLP